MKLHKLLLENFRGVKALAVDFEGKDAAIYGANGTGKTTVANAVCWLLCGAPATGEKDFSPQTSDTHNLHHRAELSVESGGTIVSICKDFYEKWTKKRGSKSPECTGHVTDYFINDVPVKKSEYEKKVAELLGGLTAEQAKTLLLLGYFAEQVKPDARRAALFEMCGDIDDDEVIKSNGLEAIYAFLTQPGEQNSRYTIDEYREIAKSLRKKLNKELDTIPARIDEQSKNIEGMMDEATAKAAADKATADYKAAMQAEEDASRSNARDVRRAVIEGKKAELAAKRTEYEQKRAERYRENQAKMSVLANERNKKDWDVHVKELEVRTAAEKVQALEAERESLLAEFREVAAKVWDEGNEICPTCGQPIQPEKVAQMRAAFNQEKSAHLEDLNNRGKQTCAKELITEAKSVLETKKAELEKVKAEAEAAKNAVVEAANEQQPVGSSFDETDEARALVAEIANLEAEPDGDENREQVEAARAKTQAAKEALDAANLAYSAARNATATRKRIEELEEQQRECSAELDKYEEGLHLCDEFTRAKARAITESINQHFDGVKWQLFREQINGGLEQVCNPIVETSGGWVEYKSANTAAQVNAGLAIIDALNKFHGTELPVIIDRAESVTNVKKVNEQIIRLVVSEKDTDLRIVLE